MAAVAEHIKVPKLRLPEFSGEWEMKKFEEIAKRRTSKNDKASGELLCIEMESIEKETGRLLEVFEVPRTTRTIFAEGDVLFGKLRPYLRKYHKAKFDGVCSTEFWVFEGDESSMLTEFLLQTGDFQRLVNISEGSKMPRADWSLVRKYKFALPSLPEQQKIAEFLTAVDEKIGKLKRKKELLEAYKKGAMQKLFSQEIRFKDDQGNAYPDWEEKRLGFLFDFFRGSTLSKADLIISGKNKCIHYGELFTTYLEVIKHIISRTDSDGNQSRKGDILMPTSDVTPKGLATASCILEDGVILGGDMNILRPKTHSNSVFFSYRINFATKDIMKLVTGTTIKHIYSKDLKELIFSIPSLPEQQKIAEFLTGIDDKINAVANQIDKAAEFKKGLLQKMFV